MIVPGLARRALSARIQGSNNNRIPDREIFNSLAYLGNET